MVLTIRCRERLYQPEKMAQFDRFFARSWATPVRRSHSAQHGGEDDDEVAELKPKMYGRPFLPLEATIRGEKGTDSSTFFGDTGYTSLNQFIATNGFHPRHRPTMRRFVQQHDIPDIGTKSYRSASMPDGGLPDRLDSYRYIGDTNRRNEKVKDEYVRCVSSLDNLQSSLHNPIAFDEFKESLHAMSLNANDVNGIREVRGACGYIILTKTCFPSNSSSSWFSLPNLPMLGELLSMALTKGSIGILLPLKYQPLSLSR